MPPKIEYVVLRPFSRTDPRTFMNTRYKKNDTYSGPVDDGYLDRGPDGKGPLIAAKSDPAPPAIDASSDEETN